MKFLVVMDSISTGGISTAFKNYLSAITRYVDCDILVFNDKSITDEIEKLGVSILSSNNALRMLGMDQKTTNTYSHSLGFVRMIMVAISRAFSGVFARKILLKFACKLKGYDVAISYTQDVGKNSLARGCNDFVLKNVTSKKKAAFIHCDYQKYGGYHKEQEYMYIKFDYVFGVSKGCCDSFIKCFPKLEDKVFVSENFINVDEVIDKSKAEKVEKKDVKNIITVCRLSKEKGIPRAMSALRRIKQENIDFIWTIVGGGDELEEDIRIAEEMGLSENIEFIGEKKNPFPYVKAADAFLLPSFHEAAPMVFGECWSLSKPILSTATSSATELVSDRKIGFVCENTEEGIYRLVKAYLESKVDSTVLQLDDAKSKVNTNATRQFENFLAEVGKEILNDKKGDWKSII